MEWFIEQISSLIGEARFRGFSKELAMRKQTTRRITAEGKAI